MGMRGLLPPMCRSLSPLPAAIIKHFIRLRLPQCGHEAFPWKGARCALFLCDEVLSSRIRRRPRGATNTPTVFSTDTPDPNSTFPHFCWGASTFKSDERTAIAGCLGLGDSGGMTRGNRLRAWFRPVLCLAPEKTRNDPRRIPFHLLHRSSCVSLTRIVLISSVILSLSASRWVSLVDSQPPSFKFRTVQCFLCMVSLRWARHFNKPKTSTLYFLDIPDVTIMGKQLPQLLICRRITEISHIEFAAPHSNARLLSSSACPIASPSKTR